MGFLSVWYQILFFFELLWFFRYILITHIFWKLKYYVLLNSMTEKHEIVSCKISSSPSFNHMLSLKFCFDNIEISLTATKKSLA